MADNLITLPLDRRAIEASIEALVSLLNVVDGDADIELNGDELDGNAAEDDFVDHEAGNGFAGPGCPVADPPEYAAPEGTRQREFRHSLPHEDDEDCEGGGDTGGDDNEPDFRPRRDNAGPGCLVADNDCGAEEPGEPEYGP